MGGKNQTTTSQVSIPPEVLARYNSVNAQAQTAAANPFARWGENASDFVAQLNPQQQAGMAGVDAAAGAHQPYFQNATAATTAGMGAANLGELDIDKFMSPYTRTVADTTAQIMGQQNEQAQSGALGAAASSGAFGGDRAGIAAANLSQQQNLAMGSTMANIMNQGYSQALGAAQQQQGAQLSAEQANLMRQMQGGAQMANLGMQAQQAGLQGAEAQMAAGAVGQQTEQAGKTALINQFMQEKGYPFQVAQFLANIAEGTGALSGSTTTTTQPQAWWSDRRLKYDIQQVGHKNGLPVYRYKYRGDKSGTVHIGHMADEVEQKNPKAVGLDPSGYKTVDYKKLADGGVAGPYSNPVGSTPGVGGYIPEAYLPVGQLMMADPALQQQAQQTLMDQINSATGFGNNLIALKSNWDDLRDAGKQNRAAEADGGAVMKQSLGDAPGGYMAPVMSAQAQTEKPQLLQPSGAQGNGHTVMGDIADLGKVALGFMGLKDGGRVGYADGGMPMDELSAAWQDAVRAKAASNPGPAGSGLGEVAPVVMPEPPRPAPAGLYITPEMGRDQAVAQAAALGRAEAPDARQARWDTPEPREPLHAGKTAAELVANTVFGPNTVIFPGRLDEPTPAAPSAAPAAVAATPSPAPAPGLSPAAVTPPRRPISVTPASAHTSGLNPDDPTLTAIPDRAPGLGPLDTSSPQNGRSAQNQTPYVSVANAGPGWTDVVLPDGSVERRTGARNWRNNNPGNIEYGDFARSHGAIGTDGRFAVFPTYEAGRAAKGDLLFTTSGYRNLSIAGAINRYAPPSENDTGAYVAAVASALGVSPDTPLSALNDEQRNAMLDAMEKVEGGGGGGDIGASSPYTTRQVQPGQGGAENDRNPSPGLGLGLGSGQRAYSDRNQLGQLMHDPTTNKLNKNALLAILSGVGTMASSPSRYLGSSILQGLGGFANTAIGLQSQQAEVAAQNIENMRAITNDTMSWNALHPEQTLTPEQYARMMNISMPDISYTPTTGGAAEGIAATGRTSLQDYENGTATRDGVTMRNSDDPSYLQRFISENTGVTPDSYLGRKVQAAKERLAAIQAMNGQTIDASGKPIVAPGFVAAGNTLAQAEANRVAAAALRDEAATSLPAISQQLSTIDHQTELFSKLPGDAFNTAKAELGAALSSLGIPVDEALLNNSADVQKAIKMAADQTIAALNAMPGGAPAAELSRLAEVSANPNLQPEALKMILVMKKAALLQQQERYNSFIKSGSTDRAAFEAQFAKDHPYDQFYKMAQDSMPAFAGEKPAVPQGFPGTPEEWNGMTAAERATFGG